jgi:replicative DNA helicase
MIDSTLTPPHNVEAEEATLGAALIDPGVIDELSIAPNEFYVVKNKWIWQAINAVRESGAEVDLLTVQNELERLGQLSEIGGPAYLTRLITQTPSAYNAPSYSRLINEAATRRGIIAAASTAARLAYDFASDIDDVISGAEAALHAATENQDDGEVSDAADAATRYYDAVSEKAKHPEADVRMPTGFVDLDRVLGGGLKSGYALMVAGEPGKGKTILQTQAIVNMAEAGIPAAMFSLEMTESQLINRIVCWKTGIDERVLERGAMTEAQWPKFTACIEWLSRLPLFISDSTRWNTSTLRAALVKLKRLHGVRVFSVDYFRLLGDRYGASEPERQEYISKRLKFNICKPLELAAIIIHTLNKSGMDGVPHMENMSGSAQIPYDMDAVMFINDHIPSGKGEGVNSNIRTVTTDKNRFGNDFTPVNLIMLFDRPALGDVMRISL